jgi:maltose/moltooligosaccharide transporter
MLTSQKNLSTGFLILLSLPTAAIGFCLSSSIASTTWLLSTRYNLHLENIALIWLMGPLMGLLVQPIVGAFSDRTWFLRGRRKPYLMVGGLLGAASTYAMLELDTLAAATGLGLLTVAVVVALLADLATNVTFNPARSLVADLTPEGPHRVRGYAWMQTVSGVLGISAYLISIFLGNLVLVLVTVAVVFFLTVLPLFFIEELAPQPSAAVAVGAAPGATAPAEASRAGTSAFRALLPMSGFMVYGVFVAVDKLLFDGRLAGWSVPLFLATVAATLAWGGLTVWQERRRPSDQTRLRTLLLGHGFAWLGVQSMFVMAFFYVRDFVVPGTEGLLIAEQLFRLTSTAASSAADTAGRILSIGFLLLNVVGAALPVLLLKPLCLRWGKVAVHRTAMGLMAAAYLFIAAGSQNEAFYYVGMLLCGIGWSSLISIVFAIFSESVDSREMGVSMGVFNSSLVLPALMVPGLLKLSDALQGHRWMFLLFAACLLVSVVFWCAVREKESGPG